MARNPFLPHPRRTAETVVVIGLGRFGRSLAEELIQAGTEVLGIDTDEDIVQSLNGVLTHVVRADSTKQDALDQLGVAQFDRVVVGIGSDLEASILTASLLKRMQVSQIWAKAITAQHGLILEQLGVDHVVFPEADMGRRVAHLVRGSMLDYVEFDRDLVMAKSHTPADVVGRPMGELHVPDRFGVRIVAHKPEGMGWTDVDPDTVLAASDTIIVIGTSGKTEKFCSRAPD